MLVPELILATRENKEIGLEMWSFSLLDVAISFPLEWKVVTMAEKTTNR